MAPQAEFLNKINTPSELTKRTPTRSSVSCCKKSRDATAARCQTRSALLWRISWLTSQWTFSDAQSDSRAWRRSYEQAKTIHCNGSSISGLSAADVIVAFPLLAT
jgi:hypothetical protein